jgi:hypothetical protein
MIMMSSQSAFLGLLLLLLSTCRADWNPDIVPPDTVLCPDGYNGFIPSQDCKKYVNCWAGERKYEIECAEGQLYSFDAQHCVDESLVKCRGIILNSEHIGPIDIVSDEACSTIHTGRQGFADCSGYAQCEGGFMMERVQCEEGSMYDSAHGTCRLDKTECEPDTTSDNSPPVTPDNEPTGQFYPNWATTKCDEKDANNEGLGVYYGYYDSREACCSHNFISSITQLESCMGGNLDEFFGDSEQFPDDSNTGYIPDWSSNSCIIQTVDVDSAAWMKDTLKSKKYECCFHYLSWDFLRCMNGAI